VSIGLHLACNDDRGNFADAVYSVEFFDDSGMVLQLMGDPLDGSPLERNPDGTLVFSDGGSFIKIHYEGWTHWAGNMAWDATQVSGPDAEALARFLLQHGYQAEEYVCDSKWERLVEECER
jgi:hypothetical protein